MAKQQGESKQEGRSHSVFFLLPLLVLPSLGGASSALAQKKSHRQDKAEEGKSLN